MQKHMKTPSNNNAQTRAGTLTLILSDKKNSDSLRTVLRLVYDELHGIAVRHCRQESPCRTLQPTALLNEACIRLLESDTRFENRRHFFGAASKTMRRVLVDHARRRRARIRGGTWRRVAFEEAEQIGFEQPTDLLDFNAALTRLEAVKPGLSQIVELRVFGGFTNNEVAVILGIGKSTARRKWSVATKQLRSAIVSQRRDQPSGT